MGVSFIYKYKKVFLLMKKEYLKTKIKINELLMEDILSVSLVPEGNDIFDYDVEL